jgi:hypothetical protein
VKFLINNNLPMKKKILLLIVIVNCIAMYSQSEGYNIALKIEGAGYNKAELMGYEGKFSSTIQNLTLDEHGNAAFKGLKKLNTGLYTITLISEKTEYRYNPNIERRQLHIITQKNLITFFIDSIQTFTIISKFPNFRENLSFINSEENQIINKYYTNYLKYKQDIDSLQKIITYNEELLQLIKKSDNGGVMLVDFEVIDPHKIKVQYEEAKKGIPELLLKIQFNDLILFKQLKDSTSIIYKYHSATQRKSAVNFQDIEIFNTDIYTSLFKKYLLKQFQGVSKVYCLSKIDSILNFSKINHSLYSHNLSQILETTFEIKNMDLFSYVCNIVKNGTPIIDYKYFDSLKVLSKGNASFLYPAITDIKVNTYNEGFWVYLPKDSIAPTIKTDWPMDKLKSRLEKELLKNELKMNYSELFEILLDSKKCQGLKISYSSSKSSFLNVFILLKDSYSPKYIILTQKSKLNEFSTIEAEFVIKLIESTFKWPVANTQYSQ